MELPGSESLLVVGDWGSGSDSQDEVAAQMAAYAEQRQVAAIVSTGDNLYSDDAEELMTPFAWATERGIPFVIVWGNHDVESRRRIDVVNETFNEPPAWWIHDWGPVDLVVLDSTRVDSRQQLDFFTSAMAASDDPTILAFHHPPYSCGSHGDTASVIAEWVSRFDDDVFMVLNGHEHNYQRFESGDVTYVVTGGGGQSLTELADCPVDHPQRTAGEAVHHFVALELEDDLSITAIDADGNIVDDFSIALP